MAPLMLELTTEYGVRTEYRQSTEYGHARLLCAGERVHVPSLSGAHRSCSLQDTHKHTHANVLASPLPD